jgi:hypothetical protein
MNTRKLQNLLLPIAFAGSVLSMSANAENLPDVTEDGLHRVKDSKMAIVYVEPGADLAGYKRVMLTTPEVAFKKNWKRNLNAGSSDRLGSSSVNTKKIKRDLAQEFDTVFSETLSKGGFEVVEDAAEDVLLVRPSIVNLDITAPQQYGSGRSNSYARSAGEMTLYIELYDSETGDLIAKAVDRGVDNAKNTEHYTWATSASNKAAADRILTGWANILLDALKEAKSSPAIPMPESDR